jgi:hypothetical protein
MLGSDGVRWTVSEIAHRLRPGSCASPQGPDHSATVPEYRFRRDGAASLVWIWTRVMDNVPHLPLSGMDLTGTSDSLQRHGSPSCLGRSRRRPRDGLNRPADVVARLQMLAAVIPLGQQLLQVPVRQPEPQVPADRQQDHLGREPESRETRGRDLDWTTATPKSHPANVPTRRRFPSTQQWPGQGAVKSVE